MSEVPIAQPVDVPKTVIADDMACVICGYNLRSLQASGRCPECGSPVHRSIHGDLLRYADAEWLGKVLLGITLMLWGILVMILLRIAEGIGSAAKTNEVYFVGPALAASVLDVLAAFLITVQEPKIAMSEDTVTWRRIIRICAVVSILGQVLAQLEAFLGNTWLIAIGAVLSLAAAVAYFGKFVYLRRFALRIPDQNLARSTRIVMWGFVITVAGAGILAGVIAFLVAAAGSPSPPLGAVTGVACVAGISGFVFAMWYLVLLVSYRNAFSDARTYSRQYAAAMPGPGSQA
ncbi:MAG TPA: hypothetical protein VMV94_13890 [Phycisphaerae bacterium]|nr:hypothetical protein [Phycisphaerae bacterium]